MIRTTGAASVLFFVLTLGVAGCSAGGPDAGAGSTTASEATAAAAPEVEPATGETLSGTGYTYVVPEGWAVPEGSAGLGSDTVAVDQVPVGDFATNVNVVLSPAGALSADEVESIVGDELEAGGATDVEILDRTTIAGSESAHVKAELTAAGAPYRIHQYYLTNDDQTYVVTFSADETSTDDDITGIADSVLDTWTWE